MKSIAQFLREAALNLHRFDTAKLDAELLMAYVLKQPRSYLYAWSEKVLNASQSKEFWDLVEARKTGEPIAYLLGEKEFWSLNFKVNKNVLIPRPDTEILVETVLRLPLLEKALIADLGTGSGAIALSLASEKPAWQIIATDRSEAALKLAKENAERLKLKNVSFSQGNWTEALAHNIQFDAIVSNPPYIAPGDLHLNQGDVKHEPRSALVSENQGLADIEAIAEQALGFLKPGAYLVVEHGHDQAEPVKDILRKSGYQDIKSCKDLNQISRVSYARSKAACSKKNSGS